MLEGVLAVAGALAVGVNVGVFDLALVAKVGGGSVEEQQGRGEEAERPHLISVR